MVRLFLYELILLYELDLRAMPRIKRLLTGSMREDQSCFSASWVRFVCSISSSPGYIIRLWCRLSLLLLELTWANTILGSAHLLTCYFVLFCVLLDTIFVAVVLALCPIFISACSHCCTSNCLSFSLLGWQQCRHHFCVHIFYFI